MALSVLACNSLPPEARGTRPCTAKTVGKPYSTGWLDKLPPSWTVICGADQRPTPHQNQMMKRTIRHLSQSRRFTLRAEQTVEKG